MSKMMSQIRIHVDPLTSMYDERVIVQISGLEPRRLFTVAASCAPDRNSKLFLSHAFYESDIDGTIDVSTMASQGGTYDGVEAMGIFWSMVLAKDVTPLDVFDPDYNKVIFMKLDPTVPMSVTISVHKGFQKIQSLTDQLTHDHLLTQLTIQRQCLKKGCKRISIREGRLRGTLFVPDTTQGQVPAILDLYGAPGGLRETRAAVLASHGYVTLALAFFNHDNLPKRLIIDLDYFNEAIQYLNALPSVQKDCIGVIGRCIGGTIALHMALDSPQIKAVVNLNGGCYLQLSDSVIRRGQPVYHFSDFSKIVYTEEGFVFSAAYPASKEHCIPIEQTVGCHFLLVYGSNDSMTEEEHGRVLLERMTSAGLANMCSLLVYPGTGHMMEPPYTPPLRTTWNRYFKTAFLWGGQRKPHAHAQEASWREIINFFEKHLLSANERKSKL